MADVETILHEQFHSARAVWPELDLTDREFAEYVAARSSDGPPPSPAHAADLYLACACASGNAAARDVFHRTYDETITRVLARRGADASTLEDLKQAVFEKLLVAPAGEHPRIADYRGAGPLKSWVASVAVTSMLMARRSQTRRREQSSDDDSLIEAVAPACPELQFLKQRYRKPVEAAIVAAASRLADRDRVLLRLHLCERLSIDRLGTMYGVNRATAARWLASARRTLLETARAEIRRGLRISDGECDSILNLVQSQLHVSLARHLGARPQT